MEKEEMEKKIAELEADLADIRRIFDLQYKRVKQAEAQWQKETGRKNVWPDLGALLTWQFDRIRWLEDSLQYYGGHKPNCCHSPERCTCGFDGVLDPPDYSGEDYDTVCVLCGRPWVPSIKNRCECGGFCTWGKEKGAEPESWEKTDKGYVPRTPPDPAKPNVVKHDGSPSNKFRKD